MNPLFRDNRLLARLAHGPDCALLSQLQLVELPIDHLLYEVRTPIDAVYFPVTAVLSALNVMPDGASIEVGTIGNEGAVGVLTAQGPATAPHRVITQLPGKAFQVNATQFRNAIAADGRLADLIFRYQQAFLAQISQSVACNGLHKIEQRCCRWLLMTHDRVAEDTFPLTHEYLAMMLGVRRAGVSEVLQRLKEQSLLDYTRGSITVQDRRGLEEHCCPCYGASIEEYRRLLDD